MSLLPQCSRGVGVGAIALMRGGRGSRGQGGHMLCRSTRNDVIGWHRAPPVPYKGNTSGHTPHSCLLMTVHSTSYLTIHRLLHMHTIHTYHPHICAYYTHHTHVQTHTTHMYKHTHHTHVQIHTPHTCTNNYTHHTHVQTHTPNTCTNTHTTHMYTHVQRIFRSSIGHSGHAC